jgi:hypothetical protein
VNTKLAETFEDQGSAHLSRWARIETDFPLTFLHSVWNVPRERGDEPIPPFLACTQIANALPTISPFDSTHPLLIVLGGQGYAKRDEFPIEHVRHGGESPGR